MESDSGTKQAGKAELVFTCLLCQRPLSAKDMELGFAMCEACRDYYCPEPGPAMEIIHTPKGPKLEPLMPAKLEHRDPLSQEPGGHENAGAVDPHGWLL